MSDGYRLWMNRDEARSRPAAEAPRVLRLPAGHAVAPLDPLGGGSWIGATASGMSVALANAYPVSPSHGPDVPTSRGLLLMEALAQADGAAVRRWVGGKDLAAYRPFSLSVFEPGEPVFIVRWDGRGRSEKRQHAPGLVCTSSSWRPADVVRTRTTLFRRAARDAAGLSEAVLDRLHASREPEPGPYAVSMERSDACTTSLSRVAVSEATVRFWYTDGPPHRTEADLPVSLPRQTADNRP